MDSSRPGEALFRLRRETGATLGYDHILSQIEGVISDLESASGLPRSPQIGIGTPGAVEPSTGSLKNSNTLCLNGRPLRQDLERLTGTGILMANDANCFALAEALIGSAAGAAWWSGHGASKAGSTAFRHCGASAGLWHADRHGRCLPHFSGAVREVVYRCTPCPQVWLNFNQLREPRRKPLRCLRESVEGYGCEVRY